MADGQEIAAATSWVRRSLRDNLTVRNALGVSTAAEASKRIRTMPFAPDVVFPAIGLTYLDGLDFSVLKTTGGAADRLWADMEWLIVGVSQEENGDAAHDLAGKLDAVVHEMFNGSDPTGTYGSVVSCVRVAPYLQRTIDETTQVPMVRVGGRYRIKAKG